MALESDSKQFAVPVWIDNAFFEGILRAHLNDDRLSVRGFSAQPAVGKGENYSSDLLRVRVRFARDADESEIGLIVKLKLAADFSAADMIEEMNGFAIEINAYRVILPKVHELLRSIGDQTVLAPKCLAANERLGYLVFEDLSDQGYFMLDRRFGLTAEQFAVPLDLLAKWHATTAHLLHQDPSLRKLAMPAQFERTSQLWRTIIDSTITTLIAYTGQFDELRPIGIKLATLAPNAFDRICDLCGQSDPELAVLCHGDLWSNNILYRNGAAEALLIDFQMILSGSLAIDLALFLQGASNDALAENDWTELIAAYHATLSETLRRLDTPTDRIPSLSAVHQDIRHKSLCSAFVSLMMMGGRHLKSSEVDPVVHFLCDEPENRQFRLDAFNAPGGTKSMHFLLKYYDRMGVFD